MTTDNSTRTKRSQFRKAQILSGEKPTPDRVHGTAGGYTNWYCRCAKCKEAWAASCYDMREKRKQRAIPGHVHGTENGYGNYGCRCRPCTTAWSDATRDRSQRRKARAA